jgi:hypothetical protein
MRSFTILILVLIPYIGFSQSNTESQYYVNGKEVEISNVFILPKNIESINVKKDKPNGEVFITTIEKPWKHKTLDELLSTSSHYSRINNGSIIPIFIIDGQLIRNKADLDIDNSYFAGITLESLSDVKGVEGDCKNITIVNIKLVDDPKKLIRIRGENFPEIDSLINSIK